jgi:hypothetical protein
MPAEGPDSPITTTIELAGGDTVVLDSSMTNYINISWDDESFQHVADVDQMGIKDKL